MEILKWISFILAIVSLSVDIFLIVKGKIDKTKKLIFDIVTLIIWLAIYVVSLFIGSTPLWYIILMPILLGMYVVSIIMVYKSNKEPNEIVERIRDKNEE